MTISMNTNTSPKGYPNESLDNNARQLQNTTTSPPTPLSAFTGTSATLPDVRDPVHKNDSYMTKINNSETGDIDETTVNEIKTITHCGEIFIPFYAEELQYHEDTSVREAAAHLVIAFIQRGEVPVPTLRQLQLYNHSKVQEAANQALSNSELHSKHT